MINQRWRPVLFCALAVVGLWIVTIAGYRLAKNSRITAEKVKAYADGVNLDSLSGEARARALRRLAEMINALPFEERQRARFDRTSWRWLEQMTEDEKGTFIEATLPTGFRQMLSAFEQLPEEKRARAINDAVRRLRETQSRMQLAPGEPLPDGTNVPPPLSPELQAKIRTLGLKAFYSQSSAQTKAELAPVLEELQRMMESGRVFRGR